MTWQIFGEAAKIVFASNGWFMFSVGIGCLIFFQLIKGCLTYNYEVRDNMLKCLVLVAAMFALYFWAQPKCPNCGSIAKQDFCNDCGTAINLSPTCPSCGEVCYTDFCGSCGASMPEG